MDQAKIADYDFFAAAFAVLLGAYSKQHNEMLCMAYFKSMQETEPTEKELWDAICQIVDRRAPQFPSGNEIKQLIWEQRKAEQPALPPAPIEPTPAKEARLRMLAGIYKHQGDTKFYRAILEGKSKQIFTVDIPQAVVTHEEVVAYCGGEVQASPQPAKIAAFPGKRFTGR